MKRLWERLKAEARDLPPVAIAFAVFCFVGGLALIIALARPALKDAGLIRDDEIATLEAQYPMGTAVRPAGALRVDDTATPTETRIPFKQSTPGLLGNCHGMNNLGLSYVSWAYPSGGETAWSVIEPTEGTLVTDTLDAAIEAVPAGKKVWLQISTSETVNNTVPAWAVAAGVQMLPSCAMYDDACWKNPPAAEYDNSWASTWDATFREKFAETVRQFAMAYDNNTKVEAILMMTGGLRGEMTLLPHYCWGTVAPNVKDPTDIRVIKMAEAWGQTPQSLVAPYTASYTYADGTAKTYAFVAKFDYYFVESVKAVLDIYMTYFKSTPVVMQLGNGISCQMLQATAVSDYAVHTYGKRVWLKQNGYGDKTTAPYDYAYDVFFATYRNLTRTIYEGGHEYSWCDDYDANGNNINNSYYCKLFQGGNGPAAEHNPTVVARSNTVARVSAICLQSAFFNAPGVYPLAPYSFADLQTFLLSNYNTYYKPIAIPDITGIETPTATTAPANTATNTPTNTGTPPTATKTPTITSTPNAATATPTRTPLPGSNTVRIGYADTTDTTLSSAAQTTNYGNEAMLYVKYDRQQRAIIKFDLSIIPEDSVVSSATMGLVVGYHSTNLDTTVTAHRIHNRDWRETEANWITYTTDAAWTNAGGDFVTIAEITKTISAAGWTTWDLTTLTQGWVDGTYTNRGVAIQIASAAVTTTLGFDSSENSTTLYRPYLDVTYSEPPTATPTPTGNTPTATNTPDYPHEEQTPVSDTWISGLTTTTNYSGGDDLIISGAADYATGYRKALLKFGGLPPGSTVYTATLWCYVNSVSSDGIPAVQALRVRKGNAIGEVTWISATNSVTWTLAGAAAEPQDRSSIFYDSSPMTATGWVEFDVTNLIKAWADGENIRGILLEPMDAFTRTQSAYITSADNVSDTLRPWLSIAYISPTPTDTPANTPTPTDTLTPTPTNTHTPTATHTPTNTATPKTDIVINEIMVKPTTVPWRGIGTYGTVRDQWVEIYNGSGAALDVGSWRLVVSDTAKMTMTLEYGTTITNAAFLVVWPWLSGPFATIPLTTTLQLYETVCCNAYGEYAYILQDEVAIADAVDDWTYQRRPDAGAFAWWRWPSIGRTNMAATPTMTPTTTPTP